MNRLLGLLLVMGVGRLPVHCGYQPVNHPASVLQAKRLAFNTDSIVALGELIASHYLGQQNG